MSSGRFASILSVVIAFGCAGSGGSERSEPPLRREISQVTAFSAEVTAIDQQKRLVTLRDAQGGVATFHADEGVKNLAQVKVGDELVGVLGESVVLELRPPTAEESESGAEILEVVAAAEPGQKPAGEYVRQIRALLTIEAIDKAAGTATLRGPAGNSHTLAVRDRANLDRAKVGDTVVATYTEVLALEVRAPAP
jgi:hypothetical protein